MTLGSSLQPKDYNSFLQVYGESKPYILLTSLDYDTSEIYYSFIIKGDIKNGFNSNYNILNLPFNIAYSPNYDSISWVNGDYINKMDDIINYYGYGIVFDGFIYNNNDLSDGLIVCNQDNCSRLRSHTSKISGLSNWAGNIINNANMIYLHENWEAFACPFLYSRFTDCKKIEPNKTYDSLAELMGSSTTSVESIIIQPKNTAELYRVYGQNTPYVTIYQDPNFRGNHVTYVTNNAYNNHIHNPRSIYKSGDLNVYLNKNERSFNTSGNYLNKYTDKYVEMTDSTDWNIENPGEDNTGDNNWNRTLVVENGSDEIRNEGVRIKGTAIIDTNNGDVTINYNKTYQGRKALSGYDIFRIPEISEIEVYGGWEVYLCADEEKNNCKYYNDTNTSTDILSDYAYSEIKYILAQPKTSNKMTQFYGHKEYNSIYGGLNGYIELYNIEGNREIVLSDTNVGTDTIFKPFDISEARVIGNIDFKFDTDNDFLKENLSRNKFVKRYNSISYLNITINNTRPTIGISDSDDTPAWGFTKGFYDKTPDSIGIKAMRAYNPPRYTDDCGEDSYLTCDPPLPINNSKTISIDDFSEDINQNKEVDDNDLMIISAHGGWDNVSSENIGSYLNITGRGDYFENSSYNADDDLKHGSEFGDNETEWLLTPACNSLGDKDINPKTNQFETLYSYRKHFANGLHGFGGMYDESTWWMDTNNYGYMGGKFWSKIRAGKSMAYSWVDTTYYQDAWYDDEDDDRNAGYIAPGPCQSYTNYIGEIIPSYVHGDHFWGYGITLTDPDRKFIKNNGFCYYSGYHGDYPDYLFSSVVTTDPDNDWVILNSDTMQLGDLNDEIQTRLANTFVNYKENSFVDNNFIEYSIEDSDNFIRVENTSNTMRLEAKIDDSLVKDLLNVANTYKESIFDDLIGSYNVGKVSITLMGDQHYDYDGNTDELSRIYSVEFKYSLSKNNHYFPEENYIIIGVNPETKEITKITSKIALIQEDNEIIDTEKVSTDLENYISGDATKNYFAIYSLINKQYRPAIYSIGAEDDHFILVKQY